MPDAKAFIMYRPLSLSPVPTSPVPWRPPASPAPLRRFVARQLRRASAWLAWLSRRLAAAPPPPMAGPLPEIEFCAAAGAPEGALFVDGRYVGTLPVSRL